MGEGVSSSSHHPDSEFNNAYDSWGWRRSGGIDPGDHSSLYLQADLLGAATDGAPDCVAADKQVRMGRAPGCDWSLECDETAAEAVCVTGTAFGTDVRLCSHIPQYVTTKTVESNRLDTASSKVNLAAPCAGGAIFLATAGQLSRKARMYAFFTA